MSKKAEKQQAKIARAHGPLGPWRLSLAVLVAGLTTGMALYRAVVSGVDVDMAMVRSFGVAFLTWIVLGSINKMLALAAEPEDAVIDASPDAVTPTAAEHQPATH